VAGLGRLSAPRTKRGIFEPRLRRNPFDGRSSRKIKEQPTYKDSLGHPSRAVALPATFAATGTIRAGLSQPFEVQYPARNNEEEQEQYNITKSKLGEVAGGAEVVRDAAGAPERRSARPPRILGEITILEQEQWVQGRVRCSPGDRDEQARSSMFR